MDRREVRRRLAARPNSVRFEEIDCLLRLYDWERVTIRGTHHVYTRGGSSRFRFHCDGQLSWPCTYAGFSSSPGRKTMTDQEREGEVQRRLRLPYHRLISGEPVEGYLGEVLELPGCLTAGETPEEALANLEEAMAAWFEAALTTGMPIPEPVTGTLRLSA